MRWLIRDGDIYILVCCVTCECYICPAIMYRLPCRQKLMSLLLKHGTISEFQCSLEKIGMHTALHGLPTARKCPVGYSLSWGATVVVTTTKRELSSPCNSGNRLQRLLYCSLFNLKTSLLRPQYPTARQGEYTDPVEFYKNLKQE